MTVEEPKTTDTENVADVNETATEATEAAATEQAPVEAATVAEPESAEPAAAAEAEAPAEAAAEVERVLALWVERVSVDLDHGDQGCRGPLDPAPPQRVVQRFLQLVADCTLRIRDTAH